MDSHIRGQISPKCLKEFVQIIERCLHKNPKQRYTMAEVVIGLESMLALQEKFNNSLQAINITIFDRMVDMIPFPSNWENSAQGDSKLSSNTKGKSSSATASNNHNMFMDIREVLADYKSHSLKEFNFADLKRATSNFSRDLLLGEGVSGRMFLGWVDKNTFVHPTPGFEIAVAVAVKRCKEEDNEGFVECQVEVCILGHLTHPNIIKLLGYCNDRKREYLLVYEYMQNQSLHIQLHPGRVSVKIDIYAFGVVLLETLTGLKAWDDKRPQEQQLLESLASPVLVDKGEIKKMIDPRLEQNYPEEGAFKCVALALRCVAYEPKDRPSSDEVLQSLKQIYAEI